MSYYWLLVSLSWLSTVRLQYINTAGPGADSVLEPLDSFTHNIPLPFISSFTVPTSPKELDQNQPNAKPVPMEFHSKSFELYDGRGGGWIPIEEAIPEEPRRRRKAEENNKEDVQDRRWQPNLVDMDKTFYLQNDARTVASPFAGQAVSGAVEENGTDKTILNDIVKRSFSPWGGKRDGSDMEHMWTWKRALSVREPSMPKRVRFSPWGGKRSGQVIYKPGAKGSKIIFSSSIPELTRIVSDYSKSGQKLNIAGIHFIPTQDKRGNIKVVALSTRMNDGTIREALPFKMFVDSLPRIFKLGHPYTDVNLKKDGKRKVKFSAWGGKRSPPIIGPIWTPAPENVKQSTLDAILLIRDGRENDVTKAS